MDSITHPTVYDVRAFRPDYFVINIRKPDGSKHLVGGFKAKEEADAWIQQWQARGLWGSGPL